MKVLGQIASAVREEVSTVHKNHWLTLTFDPVTFKMSSVSCGLVVNNYDELVEIRPCFP